MPVSARAIAGPSTRGEQRMATAGLPIGMRQSKAAGNRLCVGLPAHHVKKSWDRNATLQFTPPSPWRQPRGSGTSAFHDVQRPNPKGSLCSDGVPVFSEAPLENRFLEHPDDVSDGANRPGSRGNAALPDECVGSE